MSAVAPFALRCASWGGAAAGRRRTGAATPRCAAGGPTGACSAPSFILAAAFIPSCACVAVGDLANLIQIFAFSTSGELSWALDRRTFSYAKQTRAYEGGRLYTVGLMPLNLESKVPLRGGCLKVALKIERMHLRRSACEWLPLSGQR